LLTFDTKVLAVPASTWKGSDNTKIFIRQAGKYSGVARVQFAANTAGNRFLKIRKNGSTIVALKVEHVHTATVIEVEARFDAEDCAAGDYFEVLAQQTSGSDLDVV